jgi:hypothetical protein
VILEEFSVFDISLMALFLNRLGILFTL